MDIKPKRPWTKPVLRRLEPTDDLLKLFANIARDEAVPTAKHMK